ncbi:MAG: glycosyltransferase [Rhodopila sp.]
MFPIDWPEPFGMVMIEAMACGTPVIAARRGSVPEILREGVTGHIVRRELVRREREFLPAITRAGELDRASIRCEFESRFTSARMARDYVRIYRALAFQRPVAPEVCYLNAGLPPAAPLLTQSPVSPPLSPAPGPGAKL